MNNRRNQIIFFGFCLHLLAAIFSVGYHHCDELFQVYEFAGYKLGINKATDLPWEFNEQMRSGIQPLIVYAITSLFHYASITNPFNIALFIRVLQALFSFYVTVRFLKVIEDQISNPRFKKWLWWLGMLFWCLPYFHARFSSENFSTSLFMAGLVIILSSPKRSLMTLLAGILFGLAFLCRFQMGFMLAGLFGWLIFINRSNLKYLGLILTGGTMALVIGLFVDHWLYNEWTLTWWNYLDLNLFKDKASGYGTQPFYYYLVESLLQLIPPFSILIVAAILYYWWKFRSDVITWITLPFVLLHFFVPHKELRFLFPVLNFLPFMIVRFIDSSLQNDSRFVSIVTNKILIRSAVVVNTIALLIFTFSPADNISLSLKKIYDVTEGHGPVLLYESSDPYNNLAALNYFRKPNLGTLPVDSLKHVASNELYFFSEKFGEADVLVKEGKIFEKKYSNFPDWIGNLNFNGWLGRTFTFSIYKARK